MSGAGTLILLLSGARRGTRTLGEPQLTRRFKNMQMAHLARLARARHRPAQSDGRAATVARRSGLWPGLMPIAGWLGAALVVRCLTATLVSHPGYIDAYYSFHVATQVLSGHGLVEEVLWNYLSPPPALPRPSNAYWPPGTALFVAAGSWLAPSGLPAWRRAQLAPVLGAALLVAGAYAMTRRLTRTPRQAHTVAGLLLFSGVYFPYWVTTDGFTPFALAGGICLWLATELGSGRPAGRLAFGAGLSAGLAQAIRPDGLLLAVAPAVACAAGARRGGTRDLARSWGLLAAGVLTGVTPWVARNWLTYGSATPPGAGAALWLRSYDELFAFADLPSFARWWDTGLAAALEARAGALWGNLGVIGQPLLYYALPLAAIGAWRLRRRPLVWAPGAYLLCLYGVMSLLFPFQSVRGGTFHSLAAVLPFLLLWTVAGLDGVVSWAAARRRWYEPQAQTVFATTLVACGLLASAYFGTQLPAQWNRRLMAYYAVAAWLRAHDPGAARVMVVDPPGFWYVSGRPGVVIPSDGFAALVGAAVQYDVTYLLLEPALPAYLAPVYDGREVAPDLEHVTTIGAVQLYRLAPLSLPGVA